MNSCVEFFVRNDRKNGALNGCNLWREMKESSLLVTHTETVFEDGGEYSSNTKWGLNDIGNKLLFLLHLFFYLERNHVLGERYFFLLSFGCEKSKFDRLRSFKLSEEAHFLIFSECVNVSGQFCSISLEYLVNFLFFECDFDESDFTRFREPTCCN